MTNFKGEEAGKAEDMVPIQEVISTSLDCKHTSRLLKNRLELPLIIQESTLQDLPHDKE
jgi:hypothetical protein